MPHVDRVWSKNVLRDRTEAMLDWRGPGPGPGTVLTLDILTVLSHSFCRLVLEPSCTALALYRGGCYYNGKLLVLRFYSEI